MVDCDLVFSNPGFKFYLPPNLLFHLLQHEKIILSHSVMKGNTKSTKILPITTFNCKSTKIFPITEFLLKFPLGNGRLSITM